MHTDPHFLSHVRRSCRFNLLKKGWTRQRCRPKALFMNVMRKPAPWVIRWFQSPEILMALPLYEAYGSDWFTTMVKRSRLW